MWKLGRAVLLGQRVQRAQHVRRRRDADGDVRLHALDLVLHRQAVRLLPEQLRDAHDVPLHVHGAADLPERRLLQSEE
jgi:hypothetical protein